jgi:hypothetical protein
MQENTAFSSPIFSSYLAVGKLDDKSQKTSEIEPEPLINIINKIHEQQNKLNSTAKQTHEKVSYLSSKQVIGFSFIIGTCASLVASVLFHIFTNFMH